MIVCAVGRFDRCRLRWCWVRSRLDWRAPKRSFENGAGLRVRSSDLLASKGFMRLLGKEG